MSDLFLLTAEAVLRVAINGEVRAEVSLTGGPFTDIAVDPDEPGCVYATTEGAGVWSSLNGGRHWRQGGGGLQHGKLSAVIVSGPDRSGGLGSVYVGTEPSALYRSEDGGQTFAELPALQRVPSRPDWSFPPKPDTDHVCSLAADRHDPGAVFVGIELGGVIATHDRGESFADHVREADDDPHTLRTHPGAPDRVYEGGGSYFCESLDGGRSWRYDLEGIPEEIRYFYSLAVDSGDPDTILIAAAPDPFKGHSRDSTKAWSTVYRRTRERAWHEVTDGLPPSSGTRMGWLVADAAAGTFFYVTIPGGVYRSVDGGLNWEQLPFEWPAGLSERQVRRAVSVPA